MSSIVDLFAGPGGWDLAAHRLGLSPLGIEWDDAACATRKAAGLSTVKANVATAVVEHGGMSLEEHGARRYHHWPAWTVEGLIASPPCQAWSMAGKGGGRRDQEHVIACLGEIAAGNDTRAEHASQCEDERSMLVVEPLRWALALEPEWIALEQVPPVLGLWTMVAQVLETRGWRCWAGVLEAERYGVPQTRERAVLMAHRGGAVHPPRPTHQRYVFGEPQRHDVTLEGEVLPWVSMAQALGWDGAAYRLARGEGMLERHGERRAVPMNEPTPTQTSKARTAEWVPTHYDRRQQTDGTPVRLISVGEPAPTIASQGLAKGRDVWVHERPATSVMGDARVFQPGGHHTPGAQSENAVRVTVEQAATLQTFPPDYPWQGSRTKQFEQIGNAVPPLLAEHILSALTGAERLEMAA